MSQRAQAAIDAPWWPELLSIKDNHSFEELSRRFGINVYTLRGAFALAGVTKTLLPPGPRRPGAPRAAAPRGLPVVAVAAIAPYASLLGSVPDSAVAAMANVSSGDVAAFRAMNGIAAFDDPAPAPAPAPVVPVKRPVGRPRLHPLPPEAVAARAAKAAAAPKAAASSSKAAASSTRAAAPVAKAAVPVAKAAAVPKAAAPVAKAAAVPKAAAPVAKAAAAPVAGGFRPSRLDVLAHLVGAIPDSEVAAMAKMSVEGVRLYRKARNIPSSFEAKGNAVAEPPAAVKPPVSPALVEVVAQKVEAKVVVREAVVAPVAVVAAPAAPVAAETARVATPHRVFSVVAVHGDELRKFAVVGASILAALEIAVGALNARQDGTWRVASIREGIEALTLNG